MCFTVRQIMSSLNYLASHHIFLKFFPFPLYESKYLSRQSMFSRSCTAKFTGLDRCLSVELSRHP